MATFLKQRHIYLSKHKTDEYINLFLYMIGKKTDDSKTYAYIQRKLYLVDGFKANILSENNIIGPKGISINSFHKSAYISSCKIKISIQAKQREFFI